MAAPAISVIVPTLAADGRIMSCLAALRRQTHGDFETVIVDSSGAGRMRPRGGLAPGERLVKTAGKAGFAAAVNAGIRACDAPLVALLNDDARPEPEWLAALAEAADRHEHAGMFASRIILSGSGRLDSAGMLLCADGSSRQRGHGADPATLLDEEEVLLPSACAALYRRAMFNEVGLFDEDFFMYCEDADLGLRARWAGWSCIYCPQATVWHDYSASAGRASRLKAYFVERNRLRLAVKNFPLGMLLRAPLISLARYAWHAFYLHRGSGAAAEFVRDGDSPLRLAYFVLRGHFSCLAHWPGLWRERRAIRGGARISARSFQALSRRHGIPARQLARL